MPALDAPTARRGLLLAAALLGVLLVGSASVSWRSVQTLHEAGSRAAVLQHLSALEVTEPDAPLDPEAIGRRLDEVLDERGPAGLTWVAVLDAPRGAIVAERGDPAGWDPSAQRRPFDEVDGIVRFVGPMPPYGGPLVHGFGRVPPPGAPCEEGDAACEEARRHRKVPFVALAFRADRALDGPRDTAALTLGIALLASAALLTAAAWMTRALARAELEAEAQADQERLATIGQMTAVLTHELKNPIAALKGQAQLLAELTEGPQRDRAQKLVGLARRLEGLVGDIRDYARADASERERVDVRALVRDTIEEADADAWLDLDQAPDTWMLEPIGVRRALSNLLRNAREVSRDFVSIRAAEEDGCLVIEVADRGPGVPDEEKRRIFEPYHTTKARGTGLGLTVVARTARLHGGDVTVTDREGGGAVFTLTLPEA